MDEQGYLYKFADGKLTSMEAIWFPNGNSGWEFTTSTLGTYVWSDVKLTASSSAATTTTTTSGSTASSTVSGSKNPDTGSSLGAIAQLGCQSVMGR